MPFSRVALAGASPSGPAGRPLALGLFAALCFAASLTASTDSPVSDAAMRGDVDAVARLLLEGAAADAPQGDGMTALHWAATKGDLRLADLVLNAGANVNAATRLGGYTPLLLAARGGHYDMLRTLIRAGATLAPTTATGVTPLMLAAASGSAEAVRVLLDQGADLSAREAAMGQTALMFAAANDRLDAMQALLEAGADPKSVTKVTDLYTFSRDEGPTPPEDGEQRQGRDAAADERHPALRQGEHAPESSPGPAIRRRGRRGQTPGVDRQFFYHELVGATGGLAALHFAARQGSRGAVTTLLDAGAPIDQVTGDGSTALNVAVINGHFDLALYLLERGADPRLASENGVTPLYAALNVQWAPKALYPQPRAHLQQEATYLQLMEALLDRGADPNVRLRKKVWYSGYNFDLSGVDETGATPFWRAAYASDVDAMKLLVAHGADPALPTTKPAGRPRTGDSGREYTIDISGLPPVPVGGPGVTPLQAAAGVGYGEGFAANSHRFAPGGMLAAVQYLVEELDANVNAADHEGNTALHHAAARGDNAMVEYLVSKGARVDAVNREGYNVADMANGPVQRVEPFRETLKLLEKLGVRHQNRCVSC
jgi:uncharacterized protein